jgi:DNA-binding NtrC family response regulator
VPLTQLFLEHYAQEKKRMFRFLSKESIKILEQHSWPGNVRELQNTIERVVLLFDDIEIKPRYVHFLTPEGEKLSDIQNTPFNPDTMILPREVLDLQRLEDTIIKKE